MPPESESRRGSDVCPKRRASARRSTSVRRPSSSSSPGHSRRRAAGGNFITSVTARRRLGAAPRRRPRCCPGGGPGDTPAPPGAASARRGAARVGTSRLFDSSATPRSLLFSVRGGGDAARPCKSARALGPRWRWRRQNRKDDGVGLVGGGELNYESGAMIREPRLLNNICVGLATHWTTLPIGHGR